MLSLFFVVCVVVVVVVLYKYVWCICARVCLCTICELDVLECVWKCCDTVKKSEIFFTLNFGIIK